MCGIIAVLAQRATRTAPDLDALLDALDAAAARLRAAAERRDARGLASVAGELEALDAELCGPPGAASMLASPDGADLVAARGASIAAVVAALEAALDADPAAWSADELETVNAVVVRLKDVTWAVNRDRPDMARGIADLAGDGLQAAAIAGLWAIQVALSALDRLEVRGRDSAGLHVLITG
ncbi:MAG: glucosamine-6-phosphate synthase, partial [Actinobacteria bacterium]|nr:glucosamine-6-phosphate synthase [Actinomycetota bacterium]